MQKYVRDGQTAVLISGGYGAGWSTWNSYPEMLYDVGIVDLLLKHPEPDSEDCISKIKEIVAIKYPDAYIGGLDGLQVQWVPVGAKFRVHEYDGSESVEIMDKMNWETA